MNTGSYVCWCVDAVQRAANETYYFNWGAGRAPVERTTIPSHTIHPSLRRINLNALFSFEKHSFSRIPN